MDLRAAVEHGTDRLSLTGHDGRSGALLERRTLPDGRRVVVKRYDPASDLVMRILGDTRGREAELWLDGFFDRLPPESGHAVLGAWLDDEGRGVVVMRDLAPYVLGWDDVLDAPRCRTVVDGVAAMHRAFLGTPPAGLLPLARTLEIFRIGVLEREQQEPLMQLALRGWDCWAVVAPGDVGGAVLELAHDPAPLVRALERLPATLLHGDLNNVNLAIEPGGRLTLIDWGLATTGPGPVDLGRFLAGCGHVLGVSRDDLLALYRQAEGDLYDDAALSLGLLTGLVWLGWNKALDIVESPDPAVRRREVAALRWWLARAGEALVHL